MSKNIKISAVISAYNEEKKIKDCLDSLKWVDEIIFVDNNSTDNTLEIAKSYTSKIYKRENNLMLNVNKNFGFTKATGDWILYLDADERVTPELKEEILSACNSQNSNINGFYVPRKNMIFGKWIQHTGWYPDYQLRFFKNKFGEFPEEHVHEMIEIKGEMSHLKNNLIHYNFETISQFLHKHFYIYAPNEAEQLLKKGYKFKWQDVIRMPVKEFLSRFFAREGYLDGLHGLILSIFMGFYHFVIFVNMWEKEGFKEGNMNMLKETENEFNKSYKELNYWFLNERVKNTKNLLAKNWLKLKKKIG